MDVLFVSTRPYGGTVKQFTEHKRINHYTQSFFGKQLANPAYLTQLLNVRLESRITRRSLADDSGFSCCPRKGTVTSGSFDTS